MLKIGDQGWDIEPEHSPGMIRPLFSLRSRPSQDAGVVGLCSSRYLNERALDRAKRGPSPLCARPLPRLTSQTSLLDWSLFLHNLKLTAEGLGTLRF